MANEENKDDKTPPVKRTDHKQHGATDPQENMKGPISSLMQGIKEDAEDNDTESKEEADKKKDQNT